MSHSNKPLIELPQEVQQWMDSGASTPREFIVQVDLPHPQIRVNPVQGRPSFTASINDVQDKREEWLQRVFVEIQSLNPLDTKILRAAGAIAVRVLPTQLKAISSLSGIREILPNRRFPGHKSAEN